jgi:hypothetical protein
VSRVGRDGAELLLTGAVWLLPVGRRDWGQAMRAELAAVEGRPSRWQYALGCTRALVTQPAVLRRVGYPLLMIGALVAVLVWTRGIGYAPLRWGVVAVVANLVAVAWWGRRPGPLGPVGSGRAAQLVRAGGYLLVGGLTAAFAGSAGTHGPAAEQARGGVPVFAVLLTSCLVGLLALTARRSIATGRVLASGVGAGVAAAGLWLAAVLVAPPIPVDVTAALVLVAAAMVAAGVANSGRRGGTAPSVLAALAAGTLALLLIFVAVGLLSSFGPATVIPRLVPAALSPADDLANSRDEIQDPYVALLALAALTASMLSIASLTAARPRRIAAVASPCAPGADSM